MTTDFRALCVELTDCLEKADWPPRYKVVFQQWTDIAHAALAESDGPAVSDDREPASVATQPSDEEIMGLMPQQMHDDLAAAVRAMAEQEGIDSTPAKGVLRIILNRHVVDLARAALSRWGSPAAAPVPDFGEVAAALKVIDKMQQEWVLLGNDDDGTASLSLSMPISLRRFTVLRDALSRAATLLQQQAAPVRVSERLPGPEDCDEQGRCWLYGKVKGDWRLIDPNNSGVPQLKYCFSHWLPAHALPLPAPEGGEVSCER